MNVPNDFEATRRRETLRLYQDWLRKEDQHAAYRIRKETGSPLPAILALAVVCAVAWLAGALGVFGK